MVVYRNGVLFGPPCSLTYALGDEPLSMSFLPSHVSLEWIDKEVSNNTCILLNTPFASNHFDDDLCTWTHMVAVYYPSLRLPTSLLVVDVHLQFPAPSCGHSLRNHSLLSSFLRFGVVLSPCRHWKPCGTCRKGASLLL